MLFKGIAVSGSFTVTPAVLPGDGRVGSITLQKERRGGVTHSLDMQDALSYSERGKSRFL